MKKIYVNYDSDFYVNQYSNNDTELKEAFMEDDFDIKFGYTKVKEEDGKLVLYNSTNVKEQYYIDEELEKSKQEILYKIDFCKQELSNTDYIVAKIAEAQALGEDTSQLITKYSDMFVYRKNLRNQINELEKELHTLIIKLAQIK